jgi:hypothetical protein
MSQQLAERGQAFELPEPAPSNYHPNYTLAEQLQHDARAKGQLTDEQTAALAPSSFTRILDNGWDRWFMLVMPGNRPDALTLQLQVTSNITWWKRIEIYGSAFGITFPHITTLATSDGTRVSTVDLTVADSPMSSVLRLEFWKAGLLNSGSFVFLQNLRLSSYIGNKVVYLCNRDNPGQP